jgi:SAM-dependent methyltransferase
MPGQSFSQETISVTDSLTPFGLISGCAAFRDEVIGEIVETLIDFNVLCDSLASISENPEAYDEFRASFLEAIIHLDEYSPWLLLQKTMPASIRYEKGNGKIIRNWIDDHLWQLAQFHFLNSAGVIEDKSPYKLTNLKSFWAEISAYKLHKNQIFIDVGGGLGTISFVLSKSGTRLTIYITEINQEVLSFLGRKVESVVAGKDSSGIYVVTGAEKHLGLADTVKADRILLREVFHHLNDKEAIMASIRDHLKPDGKLIIVESPSELEPNNKYRCNKAMESDKIESLFKDFGFAIEEKRRVEDAYVWRLVPIR